MESSYNESMLDFDLSYLDYKNEIPKKTHTKESFLRLKKKVINTDALLQSHKQLKNDLMKTRNECKQIRVDNKETTEKLRSIQNENEKLKKHTNEMLQKQNYDSLQLQGLESYIKQLQELVAEKEGKIGAIELEKQLLLSSLQDQKKEHKKSLRSNIKEKNRQSSDTVASFTASDFEIEHAYSIDTGCGSSIASITSPDYSSNNSPMSLDCLSFQKSTSVVSVATSPIEFLTSVSESEPKHGAVETDAYEHATSTECSLNVPTEPDLSKICDDEYTNTQSLSRSKETDQKYLINVAVQTEPEPPIIVIDKYTSTQTLLNATNVESDANDVTSKEKNTLVEDMEVQSILYMMTMTVPAISPIPPSPVMLKDASTQCCSENHSGINCSIEVLPSMNMGYDTSANRKKSIDSNYVPLLENNTVDPDSRLETCLNVTPVKSNTNKSNRKQTDLPLPANTLVDFNDRLNDCSRKSSPNKHISKRKLNDLKDSKIQLKNHDLGLSESDSDIDDGPNLNEILNTNVSNKAYPKYKNLKEITLSKVNSCIKSYVHDANKNVLRKKPDVHISRNNSIENSKPEKTVDTPNTTKYLLPSVSVNIKKLSFKDIEKYTVIEPFESNKRVTFVSRDSGHSREEVVKDLDDNLRSLPEKTVKSPKARKELFSPVSNNSDCVTNKRVLPKRISSASKDFNLQKKYEDLGLCESDSELSNAAEIFEDLTTDNKKSQDLTKNTDVSENHVRILRSKSSRQSTLLSKTSNSENERPVRNLKRKSAIELEFASKRVLRNTKTMTHNSGLNTVDRIDSLNESYEQVYNPPVTLRKTRQSSLSNKKPICKRTLRRHKDSENNDMEITEIKHNAPISLEKINSPKLRYSRSSESESELTHQRVLRSMSSPNKNFIGSQDSIHYLTRFRLRRLSSDDGKSNEITNVSPVILQENKGDLQSPLKNKMAATVTFVPTRSKRLSTYISPTKKPAIISNPQQTLHTNDATMISESIQEGKGDLQSPATVTFVPTRSKRLSTYISSTKKPAIISNPQQTLYTNDATMIIESIQEGKGDLQSPATVTFVPTRSKRLSTYISSTKKPAIISNPQQTLHTNDATMIIESIQEGKGDLQSPATVTFVPTRSKRLSTYISSTKKPAIISNPQQTLHTNDATMIIESIQEGKGDLQSPATVTFVPTRSKRLSTYISPTKKTAIISNPQQTLHTNDATMISERIQEGKGDLQSPLKNKMAATVTFVPTRSKRLSTYISLTKKPAIISNPQQTLHTNDATMISERIQEGKGDLQSPLKNKMAATVTFVPTRSKRLSTYISLTKKPAIISNPQQTLHTNDATIIGESIQEDKGDLQSPLKNKMAATVTFVPTRSKRLSTYISPTKKPAIMSNPQQTLHTKDATIISESISQESEIYDISIPTRKHRISTYVRPLKNNNNSNKTEINNVINAETSKPKRNNRISSYAKVNSSNEINVNPAKESQVQVRHVEKCREYSNIDDVPLSMVVSYSELDIFTDCNDTPPRPKNAPSAVNKPCYKLNTFFWEMLEKHCGQHTFKRKSHLLTGSAVSTLYETLEVNIAKITKLPDRFLTSEMTELADTICNENRKVLISAILTYLMSPKRQSDIECRKYTPPAPVMSKQEQVLLFVLDYIRVQREYNIFYDILKSIEYTLFRLNHTPEFVHVENLSHFYAVTCRFVGSVDQLRTFLIDAMYCMSYKAIIVAKQCLKVWLNTLALSHVRDAQHPLMICIVYLLYYFKCEANPNIVDDLRNILVKKFFYDFTEWNETKLLQFIRTSIMSVKDDPLDTKNMRCCLILLAKREGVKWCQKNIIENMLMPLINNPTTPERVKRFCISLLGPIMRPFPNNMKIYCEIVMDKLLTIVNTQSSSHNMEESIFMSLIYLSKHNTHKVTRALLSWNPQEIVSNEFHTVVVDYIEEKTSAAWLKILKHNSDY